MRILLLLLLICGECRMSGGRRGSVRTTIGYRTLELGKKGGSVGCSMEHRVYDHFSIFTSSASIDPRTVYECSESGGTPFDVGWGQQGESELKSLLGSVIGIVVLVFLELKATLCCFGTVPFTDLSISHIFIVIHRAYFAQHTLHEHAITCRLPATSAFA